MMMLSLSMQAVVNPIWLAPEILKKQSYNEKVWSANHLLISLSTSIPRLYRQSQTTMIGSNDFLISAEIATRVDDIVDT